MVDYVTCSFILQVLVTNYFVGFAKIFRIVSISPVDDGERVLVARCGRGRARSPDWAGDCRPVCPPRPVAPPYKSLSADQFPGQSIIN